MVKGMTRRIIEIKQPGSAYFEKAVFYCRTNMPRATTEYTLHQEASRIIDRLCTGGLDTPQRGRTAKKQRGLRGSLPMVGSAAAGAGGTALLLFLLHLLQVV